MKTVAIVGAGPSGLVTAKTLLRSPGLKDYFRVTMFDKSETIGGLWAVEPGEHNGWMDSQMPTNIAQFGMAFSDLSWDSVNISRAGTGDVDNSEECHRGVGLYPRAWHCYRYLQEYCDRYIPDGTIRLMHHVQSAKLTQTGKGGLWRLVISDSSQDPPTVTETSFDYLVVAAGVNSGLRKPNFTVAGVSSPDGPRVMHSSRYRRLSDLFPQGDIPIEGKILVVGGSHSGGEVASNIELQLSSVEHLKRNVGRSRLRVVQVMPRELLPLTPIVRESEDHATFVPLEISLYDLAKRAQDPITFGCGPLTSERAAAIRYRLRVLLDGNIAQEDTIGADVGAPFVLINEYYAGFIRSGTISTMIGQVTLIQRSETDSNHVFATVLDASGTENKIDEVVGVIYANGFTASSAMDFLSDEIKTEIGFDAKYPRLPVVLDANCLTGSSKIPELSFVGFTDGPYWGGMETQARMIARKWAPSTCPIHYPGDDQTQCDLMQDVFQAYRHALISEKARVPQNLFADYVGFMEEASRTFKLERLDGSMGSRSGIVCASRYVDSGCDRVEALKTMTKLNQVMSDARHKKRFVARAMFRALHGQWLINNEHFDKKGQEAMGDDSLRPLQPLITYGGATFLPRLPTSYHDLEMLCISDTKVSALSYCDGDSASTDTQAGLVLRYCESSDQFSVWTAGGPAVITANHLLYHLEFDSGTAASSEGIFWSATASSSIENPELVRRFIFKSAGGVNIAGFEVRVQSGDQVLMVSHFVPKLS
jgi:hypothetical protein